MKVLITESQLKGIIKEQQKKPIPIDLSKRDSNQVIGKYCKKVIVPRQIIDAEIPALKTSLNKTMNGRINLFFKINKIDSTYSGIIKDIFKKTQPYMEKISIQLLYRNYGYGKYQPDEDIKKIFEIAYTSLNEKFNNFLYKKVAGAFVDEKNVGFIKENMRRVLQQLKEDIIICVNLPKNVVSNSISYKSKQLVGKCENVVVVVDSSYNKLPPAKQYHPENPIYNSEPLNVSSIVDLHMKPYIPVFDKMIDSLV
jgi:hypothetical protein